MLGFVFYGPVTTSFEEKTLKSRDVKPINYTKTGLEQTHSNFKKVLKMRMLGVLDLECFDCGI